MAMEQTIKKALKTGYGLGLLSLDQAQNVAGSVRKELHLNDEESRKLARELVKNSEKASREVLSVLDKHLESALVRTGLTSKRELKQVRKVLQKRVQRLHTQEQSVLSLVKAKVKAKLRR